MVTENIEIPGLAKKIHQYVPPNWYFESIKKDLFQRYWHERRFSEVRKLIEPVKGKVLDVGSADGVFTSEILNKCKAENIIGIDVLTSSVNWARKHWEKNKRMKFFVGDASNLKYKYPTFDAVFCMEVLEHVANPLKVLKEFKRVLRKGGYGLFMVPTDSLLFRFIWFLWLRFYPRGWVWRETHIQTYRDNYLPRLCKKAGFTIEKEVKFNLGMLQIIKVRK